MEDSTKPLVMRTFFILFFIILFCGSCNLRERELALEQRSAQLDQKEQELLLKEKTLQLKEEELLKKEKQFDSTRLVDTTAIYNPQITGNYTVKMVCTETNCPGSAVGDTKNETWQLSYQNTTIIARAMAGEQLVRTYTGTYNGNIIELSEDRQNTTAPSSSRMIVRLRITGPDNMEGQREIIQEGNCKIIYSVQLTRERK